MWTQAKAELRELVELTAWLATYEATLAAKRDIVPTVEAREDYHRKVLRKVELMGKYEL
ncbi:hypothetical protein BLA23254_06919 [Burkholderia lata]|uniref:Uncharacterized protein n=1 Tax=Burkholderia lata (strain ATCC 17760 / DSM 23089 / LMG 22485 / NCIMB 9086 / R18194 / 383) TaxID=482957 RepID=A0A6P2RWS0_BURL3|nr:hypothetical protein [Burkholderia lata]VWC40367.1 hypothetical protein BLA23254_06919 [Burkholderia lata]